MSQRKWLSKPSTAHGGEDATHDPNNANNSPCTSLPIRILNNSYLHPPLSVSFYIDNYEPIQAYPMAKHLASKLPSSFFCHSTMRSMILAAIGIPAGVVNVALNRRRWI